MVGADLGGGRRKRGRPYGSAWGWVGRDAGPGARRWGNARVGRGVGRPSAGRHSALTDTFRARVFRGETRARFVSARVRVLPIQ
jgi:hypothetical protein